jgi:hypothetical protein
MEEAQIIEVIELLKREFFGEFLPAEIPQIHIGGTQRTGKTTLARVVAEVLRTIHSVNYQLSTRNVVEIDIDVTRTTIFRNSEPVIGSSLQTWMQDCAMAAVFGLRIPDIVMADGIPVFTATHSRKHSYVGAKKTSERLGTKLVFILLETPPFEEFIRRCSTTLDHDKSDMRDPLENEQALREYWATVERFNETYQGFVEPHLVIKQGSLIEMARDALRYILQ